MHWEYVKGISWNKILCLKARILYNTNNTNFLVTASSLSQCSHTFRSILNFLRKTEYFLVKLKVIKIQVFQRGQGFQCQNSAITHTLGPTHSVIKYICGAAMWMVTWRNMKPDLRMKMSISQKSRILFLIQRKQLSEEFFGFVTASLCCCCCYANILLFYIIFQF